MSVHREVIHTVKEYLFPVFCLSCDKEGTWVCEDCFSRIDITSQLFCPLCHEKTSAGEVCDACTSQQKTSYLSRHVATTVYKESALIGTIIHTLKYDFADDVLHSIEHMLETWFETCAPVFSDIDMIIPVPLHKKRFAERGFNQAFLIGNILAKHSSIPIQEKLLIRKRDTPHQANLDRKGRLSNVVDAFRVKALEAIDGKSILLVDDVYTTGATMQTCAEVLLKGGAKEVHGWTLARG